MADVVGEGEGFVGDKFERGERAVGEGGIAAREVEVEAGAGINS